ncbi:hypothetical protein [Paracandidimonas lactea]|uniref:hypothetical protein n=1 Tax=Paracandidimonas lactea TaxID=2895524 RepID=UPI001F2B3483|nr:hypothetical protein [Paracandidimonas lactea]
MATFTTYYRATTAQDNIRQVAEKLSSTVSNAISDGYCVLSITPHVGIIDGISCTIGYTVFASKKTPEENTQSDPLSMVIAV